jgi:hypothetical protein
MTSDINYYFYKDITLILFAIHLSGMIFRVKSGFKGGSLPETSWVIYGAYGYSGALIADEAVRRGHQPLLSGRSQDILASLSKRLNLPYLVVDLQNGKELADVLRI